MSEKKRARSQTLWQLGWRVSTEKHTLYATFPAVHIVKHTQGQDTWIGFECQLDSPLKEEGYTRTSWCQQKLPLSKNMEHTIEDYITLPDKIKELICTGMWKPNERIGALPLEGFLRGGESVPATPLGSSCYANSKLGNRSQRKSSRTNTISRGFVGGRSSLSTHKRLVWTLKTIHLVDRK